MKINPHIIKLAANAGMSFDKYGLAFANSDHAEDGVDLEKFANLLIQECIQVAYKADNEDKVYAWYAIGKHFGVT